MIPLEIRDLIDSVVHAVIHDTYRHFPNGLESRCAIYAIVGAQSLSRLTGRAYRPVCGGQVIPLANGTPHFLCPSPAEIESAHVLHQLRNYHCWIQADRGDLVEVVDFTLRHSDAACDLLGIEPLQITEESYAWVSLPAAKLAQAMPHETSYYASCLRAQPKLTLLLRALEEENRLAFDHLTRQCMEHIHTGLLEFETLLKYQTRICEELGHRAAVAPMVPAALDA